MTEAATGTPLRNIGLLAAAQAILGSNQAILMSLAALTAAQMLADKSLATLPVTLMIIGTALSTGPAATMIHSLGRRRGFVIGAAVSVPAALLAALATGLGSFWLFCAALFVFGFPAAVAQQYRFAAADSVPPDLKGRAISWVLFGGVLAGFIGPQLGSMTRDLLPGPAFSGSYLTIGVLALIGIAVLGQTRLAPTVKSAAARRAGRSLPTLLRTPAIFVPMLAGAVSYSMMTLVMVAAPLAMVYACGHSPADAATAIQWHIVAMYAPSFITGTVIARIGAHLTGAIGLLLIIAAAATNLLGTSVLHFDIALVLLGIGWNFGFIASTALLSHAYRPEEAARVQGMNDQVVLGAMVLASIASGMLLETVGWEPINVFAIPVATLAILALGFGEWRKRRELAAE